ncbi:MAG: hypothetical protein Q9174_004154 [Haloplaca sp. 1 TL-2023]
MDFVQNIGERYLLGKANAVPQQLESAVKQRVKGQPQASGKGDSTPQTSGKDDEIAALKKQLAEAKLNRKGATPNREGGRNPPTPKPQASVAPSKKPRSLSGDSARSKRAPSTPSHISKEPHERHERRRGRSDSIKTAVAARPQLKAPSKNHREAQRPHSTDTVHSKAKSRAHDEKFCSKDREIAFTKPVYQDRGLQSLPQSEHLRRSESDDDFCVVEVTEEEPRREHRGQPSRKNVIEVMESHKYRTKYVIR